MALSVTGQPLPGSMSNLKVRLAPASISGITKLLSVSSKLTPFVTLETCQVFGQLSIINRKFSAGPVPLLVIVISVLVLNPGQYLNGLGFLTSIDILGSLIFRLTDTEEIIDCVRHGVELPSVQLTVTPCNPASRWQSEIVTVILYSAWFWESINPLFQSVGVPGTMEPGRVCPVGLAIVKALVPVSSVMSAPASNAPSPVLSIVRVQVTMSPMAASVTVFPLSSTRLTLTTGVLISIGLESVDTKSVPGSSSASIRWLSTALQLGRAL